MRVLVTGASGYIGVHVVRELLGEGHEVTPVVRSPARLGPLPGTTGLRVVTADLLERRSLAEALEGQDVCVHAALLWGEPGSELDLPDTAIAARLFDDAGRAGVGSELLGPPANDPGGGAGLKESQSAGLKRRHLFAGTVAESGGVGTPGRLAPQPEGSRGRRDLCRGMVRSQPWPAARRSPGRRNWRRAAGARVATTPAAATPPPPPPVGIAVLCAYRRLRWRSLWPFVVNTTAFSARRSRTAAFSCSSPPKMRGPSEKVRFDVMTVDEQPCRAEKVEEQLAALAVEGDEAEIDRCSSPAAHDVLFDFTGCMRSILPTPLLSPPPSPPSAVFLGRPVLRTVPSPRPSSCSSVVLSYCAAVLLTDSLP
jgi:hypothetical protein